MANKEEKPKKDKKTTTGKRKPTASSAKPTASARKKKPMPKKPLKKTNAKKSPSKLKEAANKKVEESPVQQFSRLTEYDVHLFREGKHHKLYEKLGSHIMEHDGQKGTVFGVWAPNAQYVSVIGDFNDWDKGAHPLYVRQDSSGIWEGFIPGIEQGTKYKYFLHSSHNDYKVEKGDPFAVHWENPPYTASIVWDLDNHWSDKTWLGQRKKKDPMEQPFSVYEVHLGSWRRKPEEDNRSLTYRELAEQLPGYVKELGFTHVEFMPVMEHPFFGSWGYQITGYFAPSSRFGTPQDFMYLVNALHKEDIGVLLDWVPSHFPTDVHGLGYFDGTHLFEHADERKGFHPDWKSYIFNFGRNEVKSFLISNAVYWLDKFHIDGLRVDAVASMLYLDYSRKEGEWIPNEYGGRENIEAINFLKEFNETVYSNFPDVHTIAEESTAWPMVSKPTYIGGLGFGMKWMMGWMHDTLNYFQKEPVHRQFHQNQITFSILYAFHENFMLPLSHDEVVYGKGPLIDKMPGDEWQKFANLRLLFGYMFSHPGAKLLFMGGEFGQTSEWDHDSSLDWHLTNFDLHKGVQQEFKHLNRLYRTEKALYEAQFMENGFEWIDTNDAANSVISFLRKSKNGKELIVTICNFTPVPRENYRVGVPKAGKWQEIFNSDSEAYGGSNVINRHQIESVEAPAHGRDYSLSLNLPPLGVTFLKLQEGVAGT